MKLELDFFKTLLNNLNLVCFQEIFPEDEDNLLFIRYTASYKDIIGLYKFLDEKKREKIIEWYEKLEFIENKISKEKIEKIIEIYDLLNNQNTRIKIFEKLGDINKNISINEWHHIYKQRYAENPLIFLINIDNEKIK